MPILAISIVFCMAWWIVFMSVLSVGVKTQAQMGEKVRGTASSAPTNPELGKKALWATIGGAILTFLFWCVVMLAQTLTTYLNV